MVNRRINNSRSLLNALLLIIVIVAGVFLISIPTASAANWTVRAQPARLVNGGPVLFQVKPPARLESLRATWLGHDVTFSFDASTKTWFALAGISLETAPGNYALDLSGETMSGKAAGKTIT